MDIADKLKWLSGNDNIIGRIGEFVAYQYLENLGKEIFRSESRSQKGYDFYYFLDKEKKDIVEISVKTITYENQKGITTPLVEPWKEFILILIDKNLKVDKIGFIDKIGFTQAQEDNFFKNKDKVYTSRNMFKEKGLFEKYGKIVTQDLDRYL